MTRPNGETPAAVRALFTAAFLGVLNAAIMFLPLAGDQKAQLVAYLNPLVALLAFLAYYSWDKRR